MKNRVMTFIILMICCCLSQAADWDSPINIKYQTKNPELYAKYKTTFELLNKWSGQNEILRAAYENLINIVEADPEFAPAYREFGRLYIMSASNGSTYDSDMLEVARLQIQKSIEIEPKYADSYVLLGHLYTNLKQYKKAREVLNKAQEIGTESSWLALNSAELYKIHREYEKEFQEYLKVMESKTTNVKANLVATTGLKKYYERIEDYKNADIWFDKSLEYAAHSAWTFGNHASDLLYIRGDFEGAIKYAEQALSMMNYGNGRSILASALYTKWAYYLGQGDTELAEQSFVKAKQIKPDLAEMIKHLKKYKGTKSTADALETRVGKL